MILMLIYQQIPSVRFSFNRRLGEKMENIKIEEFNLPIVDGDNSSPPLVNGTQSMIRSLL